jgi:hypothetical protein
MAVTQETGKKNNDKPAATTPAVAPPDGYKKSATEAVGTFDGDLKKPIHCTPIHVVLADSNIDKSKPNALIFVRLLEPCEAVRDGTGEGKMAERPLIATKKDDVVGIWFSSGMRDIAHKCGVATWMLYTHDKPIKNKPSPMKYFDVRSPKEGTKLPVREDRRKESAGVPMPPFAGTKAIAAAAGVDSGDGGDNDIPF